MKKLLALLMALVMCAAVFAGCKLDETEEPVDEIDRDLVVAEVGDTRTVTYGEVADYVESYMYYYSMYGYDLTGNTEEIQKLQDSIVDMLVQNLVVLHQAESTGLTELDETQQADLLARQETEINNLWTYCVETAETEAETDPTIDVETRAREIAEEEAKSYTGMEMTYDEYVEYLNNAVRDAYYTELLEAVVFADLSVSEADVAAAFADILAADQENYATDPSAFVDDQMAFDQAATTTPPTTTPEGFSRAMLIYCTVEGDIDAGFTELQTTMTTLANEYKTLAWEDAANGTTANAERMAAILTEHADAAAQAAAIEAEFYSDAKTRIDAAYAALEAGGDFATVMAEYTDDVNFTSYPIIAAEGMIINTDIDSGDWTDERMAQFDKLAVGQYSPVFFDGNGYSIIYYASDVPAGDAELADLYDSIHTDLMEDLKDAEWAAAVDEWMNSGIVTLYEDRYRDIGITAAE